MLERDYVLPPKNWDSHVLSQEDRTVCEDMELRLAYLHSQSDCNRALIDAVIPLVTELSSDLHLYLVITGGALTNSTWSTTSTFKRDKGKYIAALKQCARQHNTCTVHVKVEHLLLLPITTIMEYLIYHGVSYRNLPWTFVNKEDKYAIITDDTLHGLRGIPADTKLPLHEWITLGN